MANPPHGINDSFIEQGTFWLHEHPEDKVSGTLSYEPENGAVLKLLGIFGELHEALKRAFGGARDDRGAVIHGITMRGKPVSLLSALNTNRQINMPGIPHETWSSNLLVIGAHITSADDEAIFPKSYFRFEEIETWLEHSPFTDTFDTKAKTYNVLAEKPLEVAFASHADFDVSSVGSLFTNNKPATRFVIDVTTQMAITPREPQSLNWHLNRAVRLQQLASLCTGHFLPLTSFELRGPDVEFGVGRTRPAEVHFYAQMIHGNGRGEAESKRRTPIVTGPELIRFNPLAVQLWFDQFEAFKPALQLFE